MNDCDKLDERIFAWYEIAMDILCMAYAVDDIYQINRLVETYEDIMKSVKNLIKKSNFYKYVDEPFLRRWYYTRNKDRLGMNPNESPLIKGFIQIEKNGYFFTKELNL